jgi:hypothetical protein
MKLEFKLIKTDDNRVTSTRMIGFPLKKELLGSIFR